MKSKLQRLKPQTGSLGARALSAGSWNVATTIASYVLRLGSNLIMTRLLVPEAFGMIAMVGVLLTALNLFTDIGISRSIVREKDGDDPHFLRVAWVVKILRGAVIAAGVLLGALVLWLLGPERLPDGTVYAQPEMPGLIAMTALVPLLLGAASTTQSLTTRQLNYRLITILTILSQVISTVSMIIFALISPTVWALMCGMLMSNAALCLFTHTMLPGPKMRFAWDPEIVGRLWSFGKWLLGASTMNFVARNADKLILGGLLGSAVFGIYVIAQFWIEAGRAFVSRLSDAVGFPVIADVIRNRPDDVPRLFRKFQNVIDIICFSAFAFTFLLGDWLIQALYTEQYHLAGRYLQLMSPSFLILRFDTLMNLVLNMGNSRAMMITTSIRAVMICSMMPLGFWWFGIEGAIMGVVLSPIAAVPYILSLTRPVLGARQALFDQGWFIVTLLVSLMILLLK